MTSYNSFIIIGNRLKAVTHSQMRKSWAILYCLPFYLVGLNEKAELNALLEHLRNPVKVRHYKDLNILFLESHSNHYGDIFIDEYTVRKSRNFIPDPVTRLWLIHFTLRDIRHVHLPVGVILSISFEK